jgi:hypothetical protein
LGLLNLESEEISIFEASVATYRKTQRRIADLSHRDAGVSGKIPTAVVCAWTIS